MKPVIKLLMEPVMNHMKKSLFAMLGLFAVTPAWSSTFIGNGGNAGDVELAITQEQLRTVFGNIPSREGGGRGLCECTGEFENHPICDQLKKLNKEQMSFCSEQLAQRANEVEKLVDRVRIKWTNDFIEVQEAKGVRASDAVAHRDANEVYIQIDRFLSMKSFERVFLLSHELFHFTSFEGKPLTDEGSIGPFVGEDGRRQFINAMAAGAVMEAVDGGLIAKYQRSLKRPQGWKHSWLSFDGGSSRMERESGNSFENSKFTKSGANYRYHFPNGLGLILSLRTFNASKSILTQTKINEDIQAVGLGLAYRVFPFSDPLTFLGQSHFVLQALIEKIEVKYSFRDDFSSLDDTASTTGESIGCSYYMPMFWGLWLSVSGSYDIQNYQLSKVGVKYDTNKLTSNLGVSYAF